MKICLPCLQKVKECKALFTVKYAPGKFVAVAYDAAGQETGRSSEHRRNIPPAVAESTFKAKMTKLTAAPLLRTNFQSMVICSLIILSPLRSLAPIHEVEDMSE